MVCPLFWFDKKEIWIYNVFCPVLWKAQKSALQSEATLVRFFILRRGDLKKALASDDLKKREATLRQKGNKARFLLKKATISFFFKKLGFFFKKIWNITFSLLTTLLSRLFPFFLSSRLFFHNTSFSSDDLDWGCLSLQPRPRLQVTFCSSLF